MAVAAATEAAQVLGRVLARYPGAAVPRVRLTGGNCARGPIWVQVNLRVCGAPARIQVIASVHDALAVATARLDRQVARLSGRWESWPWPDPQRPPLTYISEAGIARRKTIQLRQCTPWQAAALMNAMDYHVHMFTDLATGEEAVVCRAGPVGLRLARQHRMHPPAQPAGVAITVNPHRTPILTAGRAVDRGNCYGLPFLFFTDPTTARGNLLYRRYDGDLTLITPTHAETARG
jgi:Sigma 54 modulation/S30EA ribosomal protein C terminus